MGNYSRLSKQAREALKLDRSLNRDKDFYRRNETRHKYMLGLANEIIDVGISGKNFSALSLGAELYHQLGEDKTEVKKELLKLMGYEIPDPKEISRAEKVVGNLYVKGKRKKRLTSRDVKRNLERRISSVVFGLMFIFGVWFLSFNLTGNTIGYFAKINFDSLGAFLIVLGVVGFLGWKRFRK